MIMPAPRSDSLPGRRVARRITGTVALCSTVVLAGCSGSDSANSGPPRVSPAPEPEVAAAMINDRPEPEMKLNACELLDLTTERVIALTGADMPEVEPTGSGDLGLLCTYGGPGSVERYEAEQEAASETGATSTPTSTPITAQPTSTVPEFDPDVVPDTFAAGVVKPRTGAEDALAGQPALLSNRYACSEIRGEDAATIDGADPGVPEAPAPVLPDLESAYIDCTAAPTGGGVEVHTIFVSDSDLWHITLVQPDSPRSPEADARALAGLHRVAWEVLG